MSGSREAWHSTTLGEVAHVTHGWPFKSAFYSDDDALPVVLAIGNFDYAGGFRLDSSTRKTYAGQFPKEYELLPRDLVLVMTCQTEGGEILGVPGQIPDDGRTYLHNQRIGRLVIDRPDLLDIGFAFHLARAHEFNRQLFVTASGSKILHTSPKRIEAVRFKRPPVSEQRAIAEVLGALDDKIAANTKLARTADDLAAESFKSMLRESSSRPLSDTAEFINGKAFTKDASGSGRVVIRIAELNSGLGASTVFNDLEVAEQHLARPGDILFAWSGSLTLHRWFRPEGIVNQHIFKVRPKDGFPRWLVYELIRSKLTEFKGIAADKATTMGHIQRRHLDEPIDVPVQSMVCMQDRFMTALWERSLAAEQENLTLVATRDALLPHLMSGKLRVKDAEKIVSDRT